MASSARATPASASPPLLPHWWPAASSALASSPHSPAAAIASRAARFDAEAAAASLGARGYFVVDNFLGTSTAAAVRDAIAALDRVGRLKLGKLQHGTAQSLNAETRSDRIAFLPPHGSDELLAWNTTLAAFAAAADGMRARLTARPRLVDGVLDGGLDDCNLMCAVYPGGGARYVKHRDALPYKAGRKLTVIYYVNVGWREGHGGELRLWNREGSGDDAEAPPPPIAIKPHADRLLLFVSSLEHEVLPAWRPRYALTTWMFNKRDTALELLAEEMRQRKASGRLNTQALLAALDADSSSDDGDEDEGEGEERFVDKGQAMAALMRMMKEKAAARKAAQAGK